jgi:diaminohydroxyphosphoribosylaminopyrimidine deaminase/5-amino-6-(5-phosphoribosylamino)uracil reductase
MEREDIVDWSRDSAQWVEFLAIAYGSKSQAEAQQNQLCPLYGPLIDNPIRSEPFVIGQIGQSLDGRIATASGQSHYINGASAIIHLHRIRALVDAVVIGVGTAIADDPQLTVRHVKGPQPARVVIDPNGRLPSAARCLRPDGARRIIVQAGIKLWPDGIECLTVPMRGEAIDPQAIISALSAAGFRRILIEGGANTLSRFLSAGLIERVHVMVAPMIIGSGPVGLQLPTIVSLENALRPRVSTFKLPEGDILFDCDFRP